MPINKLLWAYPFKQQIYDYISLETVQSNKQLNILDIIQNVTAECADEITKNKLLSV